jgi:hypothetical protein
MINNSTNYLPDVHINIIKIDSMNSEFINYPDSLIKSRGFAMNSAYEIMLNDSIKPGNLFLKQSIDNICIHNFIFDT